MDGAYIISILMSSHRADRPILQLNFAILKSRKISEYRFILQVQQHIHPFWTKAQVQFHTDGEHFQYQDLF